MLHTALSSTKGSLKFAILCNGTDFQRWQATAIQRLLESGHTPVLLIIDTRKQPSKKFLARIFEKKRRTFLYTILENRLFKPGEKSTFSMADTLAEVPVIHCTVNRRGYSEYFEPSDVASIREAGADFLLRFGFGIIRGEILESATYGVWSFHHGDEEKYRGGPAGFWEIYQRDPVNGAILQRLTEKLDGGIILKKGFLKTASHSFRENIDRLLSVTAGWPADIANLLAHNPDHSFVESNTKAPVYKLPGNVQMIRFLVRLLQNRIRFIFHDLFRAEQWNLATLHLPVEQLVQSGDTITRAEVHWFPSSSGHRYLADPSGFYDNGILMVLAEDFDYRVNRATIGMWRSSDQNATHYTRMEDPLDVGCHVSYPYVFEYEGEIFMVPESWQSGEVTLFKFDRATVKFNFHRKLLQNIRAVDPTLFFYEGRWWLFHTTRENSNTHLYAWYASGIEANFTPHAGNPVKIDIRCARPAGTPMLIDGTLFRPAQDCSSTYGGRIAINRVDLLSPDQFRETTLHYTGPITGSPYPKGMHTLSRIGDTLLIDGKRYVFSIDHFMNRLRSRFNQTHNHHV